jgi:hypothetical protein
MRRANAVGAGAILRTTREVVLNSQAPYFFETISVPLSPMRNAACRWVHFADWTPPEETATVLHRMRSGVPEEAEIVPLAAAEAQLAIAARARQQD